MNKATNKKDPVTSFSGLNNVTDALDLGIGSQVRVDNVNITSKGKIIRAHGYTRATTNTAVTGAFATHDTLRCYIVDNGSLLQVLPDMSTVTLATGLSTKLPMYFEELNGIVYLTNGVDFGIINGAGVYGPWGVPVPAPPTASINTGGSLRAALYQIVCTFADQRGLESGNSNVVAVQVNSDNSRIDITNIPALAGYTTNVYVTLPDSPVFQLMVEGAASGAVYDITNLSRELPFWNQNTPRGIFPTYFAGRMYTMEPYPAADMTAVWRSLPLHYHHFDPGGEGISIPGSGLMMKSTRETHFSGNEKLTQRGVADSIIIGTDREIYSYDEDQLVLLASYGVVPGFHAVEFKGKVYFWSLRGLCRALPFENLTESTVSVPPGLSAGAAVVEKDGTRRYVVALTKGGIAYNQYTP